MPYNERDTLNFTRRNQMEDMTNIEPIKNDRVLDKKPDDLTVGEALKLNLTVMAAFAAIPVVFAGGAVAYDKARTKYQSWKIAKAKMQEQSDYDEYMEENQEN
jgi:hypothetical protein